MAVAEILSDLHVFRSAQQIHATLRERGNGVGLSTVYRTLALMAELGEVDVLTHEDGEMFYLRCGDRSHHHHMLCRTCGRSVEIASPAVVQWADEMATQHGYTQISHMLEVLGLCSDCSAAGP